MAITRLERKGRKNKSRAKARVKTIKRLSAQPVIKNVDIEAIKAEFEKNPVEQKPAKKAKVEAAAPKAEEVVAVEVKVEEVVEAAAPEVKEKKKPAAKKAKKTEE